MKKIVFALLSVVVMICSSTKVEAQEKKKEMFREESMRTYEVGNTTVQLKKGTVWVYNFGDVKLHAYETKDFFDSYVYLLEKNGKAVLLECPPIKDNYKELVDYIAGLEHKNVDLIVSYHPIGAQFINTDKIKFNVFSMKHAVDHYTTGLGAPSLIGLKDRFGEVFDETIFTEYTNLKEGENEVGGFKFEMSNVDFAFDVAIPELNSVHPHMLAHDRHALIFSYEFLDAYIAQLKRYQKVNYEMYLTSHGGFETRGDVTIKIHYLNDLKEIAKVSSTKKEFIDKMNEAYPNFGWSFYLQGTSSFLFKN